MTRDLHPVAWWGWAIGVALAAGLTTNPLLLGLLFCSIWLVVANRRGSSPWARAFISSVRSRSAIVSADTS